MTKEDIIFGIIDHFKEIVVDTFFQMVNDEAEAKLLTVKEMDRKRAVSALYDVQNGASIIDLLEQKWGMTRIEAEEAVRYEKTVSHPLREIINYLRAQGFPDADLRSIVVSNNIEARLSENPTLWKLEKTPQELLEKLNIVL